MRWLSRHQGVVFLLGLVVATWVALFLVYDYRSPVFQFLKGIGTVQVEGWKASELDALCIRLEPSLAQPTIVPDAAVALARRAYPNASIRQVTVVSVRNTCVDGDPKVAWAVALEWLPANGAPVPAHLSLPHAIVLVDGYSGVVISSQAVGLP
jgi:hypothetical protein